MFSSMFSKLNLPFLDLVVQEDSYALKLNQITTAREIKDIERHTHHKGEDEKYNTILANRRYEDELVGMKYEAKDNLLRDIKKMIKDKELVNDHKTLRGVQN
jgi:hypothetical protein